MTVTTASLPAASRPYPGLRAFSEDEAHLFFGRDDQIDKLLDRLNDKHFLGIVGASGCGKSSLMRAGMISGLRAGYLPKAGARWLIADMRPGERPMRRLADALTEQLLGDARKGQPDAVDVLEATLRRGPRGLEEALEEMPLPPNTNLLILVDQFEEIFRFRDKGDPGEADSFVSLLLHATHSQPSCDEGSEAPLPEDMLLSNAAPGVPFPIYVVLTMRSDYLGECALFHGLPEALNDSQFLTPRLTREQCEEAIVGPARVCGGEVTREAANALLNDLGSQQDQLPLLQHALMRLWESAVPDAHNVRTITLENYRTAGGLNEMLSRHADAVFASLSEEHQRIAQVMFRALTGGDPRRRDTRQPERVERVAEVAGVSWEQVAEVANQFRQEGRNFLMPLPKPPTKTLTPDTLLDITHESLIRQWTRLKDWVKTEASLSDRLLQLVKRANEEQEGHGNLLGDKDLTRALQWRSDQHGAAWAKRYASNKDKPGEDYALVMNFVQRSETAWQQEEERKKAEEHKQRRERTAKIVIPVAFVAGSVAIGLLVWAFSSIGKANFAKAEAALAKQETVRAKTETEAAKREAEAAKKEIETAQARSKEADRLAENARKIAHEAISQSRAAIKQLNDAKKATAKARKEIQLVMQDAQAKQTQDSKDFEQRTKATIANISKLSNEIKDTAKVIEALRNPARTYAGQKKYLEAGNAWADGWRILRKRNDANDLQPELQKFFDQAQDCYNQSIVATQQGTQEQELKIYRNALRGKAELMKDKQVTAQQTLPQRYAPALDLLRSELAKTQKFSNLKAQLQVLDLLMEYSGLAADKDGAYKYQEEYLKVQRQLNPNKQKAAAD